MATAPVRALGPSSRFGVSDALVELDRGRPGEVLGYLGPNDVGKTTTLRLLICLVRPTSGSAEIFGMDVHRRRVAAHRPGLPIRPAMKWARG